MLGKIDLSDRFGQWLV